MTKIKFTSPAINDFQYLHSLEWLETNGIGGYASSTVSGAHSRRYHGLLVAAMRPPVERIVLLSRLDETVIIGSTRFELGTNQYPGTVHPQGYQYLSSFERDLFAVFEFVVDGIRIRKTIAAIHGENTTVVMYEVVSDSSNVELELLPLCSARDYHSLCFANDGISKDYIFMDDTFSTRNYPDRPELFITVPGASFEPIGHWYHTIEYSLERYRGLDYKEDLYCHGKFRVSLSSSRPLVIVASSNNPAGKDGMKLFNKELNRRRSLVDTYDEDNVMRRLVLAADQFVVKRGNDLKTILAGYHWFSDWGRDTMISLPGLCLVTGKYDDAKKILRAFAAAISEGMIPNRFPDQGEVPEYNTVDATLWFFHAIYKYFQYTSDRRLIDELLPVLKDIIHYHEKGTSYNIRVDQDGLLSSGMDGVQLTWMDAKVGDWVVTPRKGKAVEINALWYNALCIVAELVDNPTDAKIFKQRASLTKKSFNEQFWIEDKKYLFDYVDGVNRNDDVRPNQIYAMSLTFPLISKDRAKQVMRIVTTKLLTPRGLRSLSPDHKEYKPVYGGDQWHRDGAYHQGTVWSFLLGPYIDALVFAEGEAGRKKATAIVTQFLEHLDERGVGTVSEIFDGQEPHHPRGCMAQAWGVGEILRVSAEHALLKSS